MDRRWRGRDDEWIEDGEVENRYFTALRTHTQKQKMIAWMTSMITTRFNLTMSQ